MSQARSITRRTVAPRTTEPWQPVPRLGLALVVIATGQLMVVYDGTALDIKRSRNLR